jgi:4-oxalocrotonate tautomerase
MPVIRAQFWSGATTESKNAIAASITDVMVRHLSCPPEAVTVILEEIDKEDWFIGGIDSVSLSESQSKSK